MPTGDRWDDATRRVAVTLRAVDRARERASGAHNELLGCLDALNEKQAIAEEAWEALDQMRKQVHGDAVVIEDVAADTAPVGINVDGLAAKRRRERKVEDPATLDDSDG